LYFRRYIFSDDGVRRMMKANVGDCARFRLAGLSDQRYPYR
jgi:hypothetical protein